MGKQFPVLDKENLLVKTLSKTIGVSPKGNGKSKPALLIEESFSETLNKTTGVSPSGKATGFDPVMRWFESSYPSHIK